MKVAKITLFLLALAASTNANSLLCEVNGQEICMLPSENDPCNTQDYNCEYKHDEGKCGCESSSGGGGGISGGDPSGGQSNDECTQARSNCQLYQNGQEFNGDKWCECNDNGSKIYNTINNGQLGNEGTQNPPDDGGNDNSDPDAQNGGEDNGDQGNGDQDPPSAFCVSHGMSSANEDHYKKIEQSTDFFVCKNGSDIFYGKTNDIAAPLKVANSALSNAELNDAYTTYKAFKAGPEPAIAVVTKTEPVPVDFVIIAQLNNDAAHQLYYSGKLDQEADLNLLFTKPSDQTYFQLGYDEDDIPVSTESTDFTAQTNCPTGYGNVQVN